ncbi:hypothetical protein GCM10027054_20490 [Isoptericola nanjingensis]
MVVVAGDEASGEVLMGSIFASGGTATARGDGRGRAPRGGPASVCGRRRRARRRPPCQIPTGSTSGPEPAAAGEGT